MLTKSMPVAHMKTGEADGLSEGQFEALVSVFGNKDSYGDVVMPGAFSETLADWKASGVPIPVVWSHQYADPESHIGYVLEAEERLLDGKSGLWVKGQLDTDPDAPRARQVSRLLRGKRVTQFSFSYDVLDGAQTTKDGENVYELRRLKLYEVGPTLIGANDQTELLNAKALQVIAAEVKAGRVLSAKNEELLRTAHASIGTVLAALDSNDDSKATAHGPGKAEDPARGKAEDPIRRPAIGLSVLALELELAG